jgi:hypothetical protein
MILLAILANAILGGIWRRILGGWFSLRRSYIVAAGVLLTWPVWLVLPWFWAAPTTGAIMLFWTMGHRFDKWTIILRYPLVGVIYPITEKLWPTRYTEISEFFIGGAVWGAVATVLIF